MAREKELTNDDKFEMLLEALTQQRAGGVSAADLKEILAQNSQAVQKALKPENPTHSGLSHYRPKGGDRTLPYHIFYNGFPVHEAVETHTDPELDLLLQVEPGEYPSVIRNDHTPMHVSVTAERDATGKITKVEIAFPVSREDKSRIPPMQVLLHQLVHGREYANPMHGYVAAVQDRLTWVMDTAVPA